MIRKVFDFCVRNVNLTSLFVVASFALACVLPDVLFAQGTSENVTVVTPSINWGTMASDLIGVLTKVIIVGMGIALSVWALAMIPRLLKRSAS